MVTLFAFFNLLPYWLYANNEEKADIIEIVQLRVVDNDDKRVEIIFYLQDGINPDFALAVNRFAEISWDEIGNELIGDLEPWEGQDNHYIFRDYNPPEGSSLFYYLAVEEIGDAISNIHETIYLQEPEFELCNRELTLSWNHYRILTHADVEDGQPPPFSPPEEPPFSHYRIFLNEDEFMVAYDDASGIQSKTLVATDPGAYDVQIEAVDDGDPRKGSLSNQQMKELFWLEPEIVAIDYVSINEAGDAEIMIRGDDHYKEFAYRVFRSDNPSADFEQVGEVRSPANKTFEFVDELSSRDEDASSNIWYYRAEAVLIQEGEPCEEAELTSEPESTIFLEVAGDEWQEADIWEVPLRFEHYPSSASYTYDIARRVGDEGNFEIVAPYPEAGSYVADLSDLLPFAGDVFFRVEGRVQGEAANVQGKADDRKKIFSNVVRVTMEPEVNVPNAFRPASEIPENREFRPVFVGFEPEGYRLVILDRNGLEVFSSVNFEDGWDGTRGGTPMPEGTYVYHLRYTDAGGESHEKKGVVYLVR